MGKSIALLFVSSLLGIAICSPYAAATIFPVQDSASAGTIAELLDSDYRPPALRLIDEYRSVWQAVRTVYKNNEMQPLWTGSIGATRRAKDLVAVLEDAASHGLLPAEYDTQRFSRAFEKFSFSRWKESDSVDDLKLDVSLTAALIAYANDMWDGRVEPADVRSEHEVYLQREKMDALRLWQQIEENGVESALAALQPQHEFYRKLTRLMDKALTVRSRGGYTLLPDMKLERGDQGEAVYALMKRLRDGGYLVKPLPAQAADAVFNADVENAVRLAQRESALKEDGIVGPETISILNQTIDEQIRRIAVNLDRWRWLPRDLGDHYLWVNIPEYRLRIYENGKEQWHTRVITGSTIHRTPIFADNLEYIVFSPSWHVPKSIIANELLPMFRDDPARVAEKNMEITNADDEVLDPNTLDWSDVTAADINIRQKPGPTNALGRVKFIFPNRHAIYIHDTPSDHLFDNSKRDFSHGCVRVAEPERLANYLLRDDAEWSQQNISDAMQAEEEAEVVLPAPLPVYITYFTVMPGADGDLKFLADVYEHDRVMKEALAEETPRLNHVAIGAATLD